MTLILKQLAMSFSVLAVVVGISLAPHSAAADDTPEPPPAPTDDKDKKEGKALRDIRDLIAKTRFKPALAQLGDYTAARPGDVNGWNLRGYVSRKLGRFDDARKFYDLALAIDPDHKPTLEYKGEMFVQIGQHGMAAHLLNRLEQLCPEGCREAAKLAAFIKGDSETAFGDYGRRR